MAMSFNIRFRPFALSSAALLMVAVLFTLVSPSTISSIAAQEATPTPFSLSTEPVISEPMPASYQLSGVTHIYQGWNNCGPATLTMGLTYFGATIADQNAAALWLKPNSEDKNVSPWQIVTYVNEVLNGTTRALLRQGGSQDGLKRLISSNFPVMIESGYDPEGRDLGWMGHYLLMTGYDDTLSTFYTMDSYDGPNLAYSYDHINEYWRHFNRLYIVLYNAADEAEVMTLLGSDADATTNIDNALNTAREEATASPNDPFAWYNIGTNFVARGNYEEAAAAYDYARAQGLPFRMNWYQFGMFEAYLQMGRPGDVIALAQSNLNDGGGQYVEETFYYGGRARALMGETSRAIDNLNGAIAFNPNFTPAREALAELQGS